MSQQIYDVLRGFEHAYPNDVFPSLSGDEVEAHSEIVARASAHMGRYMAQFTKQAADEIARLRVELLEAKGYNNHWAAVAHKLGLKLDAAEMALQNIALTINETGTDRAAMTEEIRGILAKLPDLRKSRR